MKYIRTKDGVYDGEKYNADYELDKALGKIIKQADTIDELCDEFVYCYKNDMPILVNEEQIKQLILLGRIQDVRGAIWTNNGLIYVAKMNEKGELELI